MKKKAKNLYIRKFLNPKKGTASIEVKFKQGSGNIKIMDCHRAITLDFYNYDMDNDEKQSVDERVHKLNVLIDCLNTVKTYLEGDKNNEAN